MLVDEGAVEDLPRATLLLLDGHSLAYRAFYALPEDLSTPDGTVTNAVYGFTSMLVNVLKDHKPDYLAVSFDVGRTFRDDLYADYKGTRARMPDDLAQTLQVVLETGSRLFDELISVMR